MHGIETLSVGYVSMGDLDQDLSAQRQVNFHRQKSQRIETHMLLLSTAVTFASANHGHCRRQWIKSQSSQDFWENWRCFRLFSPWGLHSWGANVTFRFKEKCQLV